MAGGCWRAGGLRGKTEMLLREGGAAEAETSQWGQTQRVNRGLTLRLILGRNVQATLRRIDLAQICSWFALG